MVRTRRGEVVHRRRPRHHPRGLLRTAPLPSDAQDVASKNVGVAMELPTHVISSVAFAIELPTHVRTKWCLSQPWLNYAVRHETAMKCPINLLVPGCRLRAPALHCNVRSISWCDWCGRCAPARRQGPPTAGPAEPRSPGPAPRGGGEGAQIRALAHTKYWRRSLLV